jgi:rhamnogalacturonyl hydrolase YesR
MTNELSALLERVLARDPRSLNTDWDGTLLVTAMLEWGKATGDLRFFEFGETWFAHHCNHTRHLSDEEIYASYIGIISKIIREGPIPFTAYCGHWGLAYPMPTLEERFRDDRARQVATAVAEFLLHTASRSPHGCLFHDDGAEFLIPDTCYFAAPIFAIAGHLTGKEVYVEQAVQQLIAYTKLMQDPQTGLAHTLWSPSGMPRNFWSRASGWLAGAYMNSFRYLPGDHPKYGELVKSFQKLMAGVMRVQRDDGGFHLLLDRPDIPVDCTAPAMLGLALRYGCSTGLLGSEADEADEAGAAAWEAAQRHIDSEGRITGAYTSWAKPAIAEQFAASDFDQPRDFVPGLLLLTGAAFAKREEEVAA